jgi:acetyltransferase-like isoleucine patch superfamily enzyme
MAERAIRGLVSRMLQGVARAAPGARSLRVRLHRWRGVTIGEGAWIGYDVILETSKPHLIRIGARSIISIRATFVAHFRGAEGITVEDDVFIGPGAIVLPNVRIGRGAVVTAGSVVATSVPPMTVVQGNPARPIATCGRTLVGDDTLAAFQRSLRPIRARSNSQR